MIFFHLYIPTTYYSKTKSRICKSLPYLYISTSLFISLKMINKKSSSQSQFLKRQLVQLFLMFYSNLSALCVRSVTFLWRYIFTDPKSLLVVRKGRGVLGLQSLAFKISYGNGCSNLLLSNFVDTFLVMKVRYFRLFKCYPIPPNLEKKKNYSDGKKHFTTCVLCLYGYIHMLEM